MNKESMIVHVIYYQEIVNVINYSSLINLKT
jgi:hypothetical protein